jgi:tyrosyl-tRNA synthetase
MTILRERASNTVKQLARQHVRKAPRSTSSTGLGTYGERVGRERAARRRAARERSAREQIAPGGEQPADGLSVEPETIEIPQSDLVNELSVFAALIMTGLVRSHPEAKRRFRDDGLKVNDVPVLSDKAKLRPSDVTSEGLIRLSLGKRHILLRPA